MSGLIRSSQQELTAIALNEEQCEDWFIADKIAPVVQVNQCDLKYPDFGDKKNLYTAYDSKYSCLAEPNEIPGDIWTYKYFSLQNFRLATKPLCLDDLECYNAQANGCGTNSLINVEEYRLREVFNAFRLQREAHVIDKALDPDNNGGEAGAPLYDPVGYTDPVVGGNAVDLAGILDDLDDVTFIRNLTRWIKTIGANCLVLPEDAWCKMIFSKSFLQGGCNTDPLTTITRIEQLLGVRIAVSRAKINRGTATNPDIKHILDNQALLFRSNQVPSIDCNRKTFMITARMGTYQAKSHVNEKVDSIQWQVKVREACHLVDAKSAIRLDNLCAV